MVAVVPVGASDAAHEFVKRIVDKFEASSQAGGRSFSKVLAEPASLNVSAAKLLEAMKVERNGQTPFNQLKRHVFVVAFQEFTDDEKLGCIAEMKKCSSVTDRLLFKAKLWVFKVEAAAAAIVSHPATIFIVGMTIAWHAEKACVIAKAYFSKYVWPRYAPKLAGHWVVSTGVQVVEYVCEHQFKIFVLCSALVKVAGPYKAQAEYFQSIVLFPAAVAKKVSKIPSAVFSQALEMSNKLESRMAGELRGMKDQAKAQIVEEDLLKAYHLWMHLKA
jgi:hypothetical protein